MDLPLCKLCGERHRLGGCPSLQGPSRSIAESKRALEPPVPPVATVRRKPKAPTVEATPQEPIIKERKKVTSGRKKKPTKVPKKAKVKRGRPRFDEVRTTITALKPWKSLKISRATYYRNRHRTESPK